jgi:hypothetical protein
VTGPPGLARSPAGLDAGKNIFNGNALRGIRQIFFVASKNFVAKPLFE